jgi:hypothetical protein
MCEVHKPEKLLGINVMINNLSAEGLAPLPPEGAYIETDRGDFMIQNKFFGDELMYLLIRLTNSRKIFWTVKKGKNWRGWMEVKYGCTYDGLNVFLGEADGGGLDVALTFDGDKRHCLTGSKLTMQLYEIVTNLVDPDNRPVFIKYVGDKEYLDMQANVAHQAINKLRSLLEA